MVDVDRRGAGEQRAMSESQEGEQAHPYVATQDELLAIDVAIASIDAGELATDDEMTAAVAKFRSARS
ncbi:MAG: hypothetical protein JOZ74_05995 [Bradyrhizobium sp.]|nr:hypothetical protein [Bradyrhizobium sp.]